MKNDNILEEIKARTDIVEFISDYVPLKKSGQNFKGLCPFHSEKTPSFMVSPAKQIFHCFGCGAGGDVVGFLMKQENLSFPEALRYIAVKAGITITDVPVNKGLAEKRELILRANDAAMNFFMQALHDSRKASAYLQHREIDRESIETFSLGYAPDERNRLYQHLKKSGFTDALLLEAGLVVAGARRSDSPSEEYRDLFRNRIIFPIYNLKKDVIAFGGRVMDDALPKYLNSPETVVFKKGESLFAIHLAKDEIRLKGYAVIVEGYLDAILCHCYGFQNTVAPLGTALTPRQLQKLKPLAKKVVLVFDGDDAGISAAKRSLAILAENDVTAKVLLLPKGEDPDSFLRKNGSRPFKKLLSDALSPVAFLLKTTKGDRVESVKEAVGMIAAVKDLIAADAMLAELADRTKIHESVLRNELDSMKKKSGSRSSEGIRRSLKHTCGEEYLLLSAVMAFPERAAALLSRLDIGELKDATIRSVFVKIKAAAGTPSMSALLEEAGEAERTLITELSLNPGFDPDHVERIIEDCLHTLRQKQFDDRKRLADESGDIALLDSLLKEKRKMIKRICQ
jgi:DNA primase